MSFQDFKSQGNQISLSFSYFFINNTLLNHILASLSAHQMKLTEKSGFAELKVLSTFLVCKKHREEKSLSKFLLTY